MNETKIIVNSIWYGSMTYDQPNKVHEDIDNVIVSGAVLVWHGEYFQAYIGVSDKDDETLDAEEIASWGNKISKEVAFAIFGESGKTYGNTYATILTHYKD